MSQIHGLNEERQSLINDLLRLIQESDLGQEIITACMEKRIPPKICAERTFQFPRGLIYQNNPKIRWEWSICLGWNIHKYPFSRDFIGIQSGSSWIPELSVRSINSRSLDDSTLDIEFTSIFCFIISTLLVFILSLSLAMVILKCYDYFKSRNTQVNVSNRL